MNNQKETYFDKANQNMIVANLIYSKSENMPALYCQSAFHLQQCLWFLMRYLCQKEGIELEVSMNLRKLHNTIVVHKLFVPKYISDNIEVFMQWDHCTRFHLGYQVDPSLLRNTIQAVEEYMEYVEEYTTSDVPETHYGISQNVAMVYGIDFNDMKACEALSILLKNKTD